MKLQVCYVIYVYSPLIFSTIFISCSPITFTVFIFWNITVIALGFTLILYFMIFFKIIEVFLSCFVKIYVFLKFFILCSVTVFVHIFNTTFLFLKAAQAEEVLQPADPNEDSNRYLGEETQCRRTTSPTQVQVW